MKSTLANLLNIETTEGLEQLFHDASKIMKFYPKPLRLEGDGFYFLTNAYGESIIDSDITYLLNHVHKYDTDDSDHKCMNKLIKYWESK